MNSKVAHLPVLSSVQEQPITHVDDAGVMRHNANNTMDKGAPDGAMLEMHVDEQFIDQAWGVKKAYYLKLP